jgi:ribonuclease HII
MTEFASVDHRYGWATNKGYGTKAHRLAVEKHGVHPLHRRLFTQYW